MSESASKTAKATGSPSRCPAAGAGAARLLADVRGATREPASAGIHPQRIPQYPALKSAGSIPSSSDARRAGGHEAMMSPSAENIAVPKAAKMMHIQVDRIPGAFPPSFAARCPAPRKSKKVKAISVKTENSVSRTGHGWALCQVRSAMVSGKSNRVNCAGILVCEVRNKALSTPLSSQISPDTAVMRKTRPVTCSSRFMGFEPSGVPGSRTPYGSVACNVSRRWGASVPHISKGCKKWLYPTNFQWESSQHH